MNRLNKLSKWIKKHWAAAVIFYVIGSFLNPLPDKFENLIINHFTKIKETKKNIVTKILSYTDHISYYAARFNSISFTINRIICKQYYHRSFVGLPCNIKPISERHAKFIGATLLQRKSDNLRSFDQTSAELNKLIYTSSLNYPDLIPLLQEYRSWRRQVSNNCYFPTITYLAWGYKFAKIVDPDIQFNQKEAANIIKRSVELSIGAYPKNCTNYSEKDLNDVIFVPSEQRLFSKM